MFNVKWKHISPGSPSRLALPTNSLPFSPGRSQAGRHEGSRHRTTPSWLWTSVCFYYPVVTVKNIPILISLGSNLGGMLPLCRAQFSFVGEGVGWTRDRDDRVTVAPSPLTGERKGTLRGPRRVFIAQSKSREVLGFRSHDVRPMGSLEMNCASRGTQTRAVLRSNRTVFIRRLQRTHRKPQKQYFRLVPLCRLLVVYRPQLLKREYLLHFLVNNCNVLVIKLRFGLLV